MRIESENKALVYRHIRPDRGEVFYIGVDLQGKSRSVDKKKRNNYWKRVVNLCGGIFNVQIVLDNLSPKEALNKEKEFIALYGRRDLGKGTLVNLTDGGEGALNPSPEIRKKLSDQKKGNKNPFYKKTFSEEHILNLKQASLRKDKSKIYTADRNNKISESQKGKIISEVTKKKLRKYWGKKHSMYGKSRSEKTKLKISESHLGGKCYLAKKVINTETGKMYGCIKDVLVDYKGNYSTLCARLQGRIENKTVYKYI